MTSNLPDWDGADEAYIRAYIWTNKVAMESYQTHIQNPKVKTNRQRRGWEPPEDVIQCRNALHSGDEETIKGLNLKYIDYWS